MKERLHTLLENIDDFECEQSAAELENIAPKLYDYYYGEQELEEDNE